MKTAVNLKPKKSVWQKLKASWMLHKWLYIMSIPFIAYFIIFKYIPMYGAQIAFKDYDVFDGIVGSPWVGLKHFKEFLSDYYFARLVKNTLAISLLSVVWSFPAPILFALLMNELRQERFKKVVQTITYLPHFISVIVICGMLVDFLAKDGLITTLLHTLFGMEPTYYLSYPQYFRTIYIASDVWAGFGWGSIVYLAALTNIDQELYEAATIDGAGKFKQVLHVTIPGILPMVMTMLIMRIGHVMGVGY